MKTAKPMRMKHTSTQIWNAPPNRVFPLLCPVRETEWVPGWDPKLVVSDSGVMELGCLFVEPETPCDAIWVVTTYDPGECVEMLRVLPGITVSKFTIRLEPESKQTTRGQVSYEHTALSEEGEKVVSDFTEASFAKSMNFFTAAINHYLTTGLKLDEHHYSELL